MYEKNKEIFFQRIENLISCLEKGLLQKKSMLDEEKEIDKNKKRKTALITSQGNHASGLQSMDTQKIVVLPEQKKDTSVFRNVVIDKSNKISSFEIIGWTDPSGIAGSSKAPLKWLKSLTLENYIYPESSFNPNKPPPCIFVPEPALFNKMIEAVAKSTNLKQLMGKFADFKPPKPQWLLEEEEKKRLSMMNTTLDLEETLDNVQETIEENDSDI